MAKCQKKTGPGYATPMDAFLNGPREKLLYVVCIQPDHSKQDYLATVDVDPQSPDYCKVIHRTYTGSVGDEIHHMGWNVCSSCHCNPDLKRDKLVLPALHSCKVFFIDVGKDERKPELHKVISGEEMKSFDCSFPHTAHCLASGEIMISTMGDKNGEAKGDFILIDAKNIVTKARGPALKCTDNIAFGHKNKTYILFTTLKVKKFLVEDAMKLPNSLWAWVGGPSVKNIFKTSVSMPVETSLAPFYSHAADKRGTWTNGKLAKFGYDFWYQPYHDVMVSSEWGTPKYFKSGFHPEDLTNSERYGTSLNFFKWSTRELIQTIDLGVEGIAPLEVRFLHDPKSDIGYVGCAVYANVFMFTKDQEGVWSATKVVDVPTLKVSDGQKEFDLNGLMSDIIISLDDKYLYFSDWMHGDVRQYDISDPKHPKLVGQIWLAGQIVDNDLKIIDGKDLKTFPKPVTVRGKRLNGGPQMLQLSLDGKRLYVSSSLYSPWDKQFYPKMVENGAWMVKLDIDTENGGLALDENFLIDFGTEPNGPVLAHEMRYPGGDCTSDIWLAN